MKVIRTGTNFLFVQFEEFKKDGITHIKSKTSLEGIILGRLSKGSSKHHKIAIQNGITETDFEKYFILKKC